ncbi:MAG: hypothetical protein ACREIF_16400 [Chthoniobacterales bacterium]
MKPKPRILNSHTGKARCIDTPPQPPRPKQHRRKRRVTSSPKPIHDDSTEERLPRIGTLIRTRRLLLAALRVWELKNGIRD